MKTDRGKAVRGKGGRSQNARFVSSITAILKHQNDLAAIPATDEQLAQIWPPWNALPAEMLPEEKRWTLTAFFCDRDHSPDRSQRREHLAKLKQRFAYLPLNSSEYSQALKMAHAWATLTKFVQTTVQLHKTLVEAQLDYSTFDNVLTGRVAISRKLTVGMHS